MDTTELLVRFFRTLPDDLKLLVLQFVFYCEFCANKCYTNPQWEDSCEKCGWSCCPKQKWMNGPEGCGGGCLCLTRTNDLGTPVENTMYFYLYRRPQLKYAVRLLESRVLFVRCQYNPSFYTDERCKKPVRYRKSEHGPWDDLDKYSCLCYEHENYYYTEPCSKPDCGEGGSQCYCSPGWDLCD